ncbi:MAG: hypothetical protein DRG39_06875 [Deltaproteobacteria bacterium]|nr:MAG: hypothetical protein DRG39_06875 [Deltaproteobacteria bacterium]
MAITKKNQLVGLDIGSYAIKVVEIEHKKDEKILKNVGIAHIPVGSLSPDGIKDTEAIKKSITGLFSNLKISNKKVAVSLSGTSVIAKKISLADREDLDLEDAIRHEAEQFVPFDMEDINLDFDIMATINDESGDDDTGRLEIMVVAAKKSLVENYISMFHGIGLSPGVMDVDMFAMQNAFEISVEDIDPEKCYILIDIGAENLKTNVVKGNVSLFVRSSLLGGTQVTKQIMEEFQIGFDDAEKIKLGATELEETQNKKIRDIFKKVTREWVDEIRGNIEFINRTYPGEEIERIFITGGSSKIVGLKELINKQTGIPVEDLYPFSGLNIDKKIDPEYLRYIAPLSAVAVGLALRSIGDK